MIFPFASPARDAACDWRWRFGVCLQRIVRAFNQEKSSLSAGMIIRKAAHRVRVLPYSQHVHPQCTCGIIRTDSEVRKSSILVVKSPAEIAEKSLRPQTISRKAASASTI
jgi:hypothetical protein